MRDAIKLTLFGVMFTLASIPLGVFGQWNEEAFGGYGYVFELLARYSLLFGLFSIACGIWLILMTAWELVLKSHQKISRYT